MRAAVGDRHDSAQGCPPAPALCEKNDPRPMLINPLPATCRGTAAGAQLGIRDQLGIWKQRLDGEVDTEHCRDRPSLTCPNPLHRAIQPITVREADDVVPIGDRPVDEPLGRRCSVLQRVARSHLQMRPYVCHE